MTRAGTLLVMQPVAAALSRKCICGNIFADRFLVRNAPPAIIGAGNNKPNRRKGKCGIKLG